MKRGFENKVLMNVYSNDAIIFRLKSSAPATGGETQMTPQWRSDVSIVQRANLNAYDVWGVICVCALCTNAVSRLRI
jgi:hypothetical protein